jgi:hypothetical protein
MEPRSTLLSCRNGAPLDIAELSEWNPAQAEPTEEHLARLYFLDLAAALLACHRRGALKDTPD